MESPILKEPVVALMEAGFLKHGFVNVMATRAFQDSTTRGFDSTLASFRTNTALAARCLRPVRADRFELHAHNENYDLTNGVPSKDS